MHDRIMSDKIKQLITVSQAFEQYGFEVNRGGFIVCPFHSEKTPSLKVYAGDTKWKCFGCNEGGDIVDFVMKLFNINFQQAIVRLNNDFSLGLTNDKPSARDIERMRRERADKDRELQEYRSKSQEQAERHRRLWWAYKNKVPKSADEPMDAEFIEALHTLDFLQYWFEQNPAR